MEEETSSPKLLLTFPGCEYIGDSVVSVAELLPPDETAAASDDDEVPL
jgi:hypothetical protein